MKQNAKKRNAVEELLSQPMDVEETATMCTTRTETSQFP
jgi:hypothetical protein